MITQNFKRTTKSMDAIRRITNNRFVLRSNGDKAFQSIVDQQDYLKSYFEQAGAELIIDEALGVIYLKEEQIDSEDGSPSNLCFGKNVELNALETMAVFFVRQKRLTHLEDLQAVTDSAIVASEELRSNLLPFSEHGEGRTFQKIFERVVTRFLELKLLTMNQDQTFTITPVCEIILPADLIAEYRIRAEKYFEFKANQGKPVEIKEEAV